MSLSVEVENVRKDVRMRVETDSMMSTAWVLAYLLPSILAIAWVSVFLVAFVSYVATVSTTPSGATAQFAPSVLAFVGLLYLFMIVGLIVNILLIYELVRRRNMHFRRQIFLFEDILTAVKAVTMKRGVDAEITLASCDRTVREVRADETEKGAVLWAILSAFVFPLAWYVYYFLMKDFYKHERREDGFWEDISRILDKDEVKFSAPRRTEPMPERSFALYLVLSIVTLGFFGIYWLYVLLKDPNEHFTYHIQVEDQLLTSLETGAV
jgi:uncharacterized membrane protein